MVKSDDEGWNGVKPTQEIWVKQTFRYNKETNEMIDFEIYPQKGTLNNPFKYIKLFERASKYLGWTIFTYKHWGK